MQLRYGSFYFPVNGVKVTSTRQVERGKDGVPWRAIDRLQCDGYLEGAGQAALSALTVLLERALATPYRDLVLVRDDGGPSATLLTNADSITGVVVTDGPHFPDVIGAEYVSQRRFEFTAEADYPLPGVFARTLLDFGETVRIQGGGPKYVVRPALVGPPQRQLVYERTPGRAVQQGFAVGATAYPTPPGPNWPQALSQSPDVTLKDPVKRGRRYTDFRIDWEYTFDWVEPLVGVPHRWPL